MRETLDVLFYLIITLVVVGIAKVLKKLPQERSVN